MKSPLFLGADHRGFRLKEKIKPWLQAQDFSFEDLGAYTYQKDDDYPDFAKAAGEKVAAEPNSKGILICGSGIGMIVAANKIKGIRAGTMASPDQVKASVADEDTNIIGLSADYLNEEENIQIVKSFLEASFSGSERHKRRIEKIKMTEEGKH